MKANQAMRCLAARRALSAWHGNSPKLEAKLYVPCTAAGLSSLGQADPCTSEMASAAEFKELQTAVEFEMQRCQKREQPVLGKRTRDETELWTVNECPSGQERIIAHDRQICRKSMEQMWIKRVSGRGIASAGVVEQTPPKPMWKRCC